jgi:hypothetical protein
MMRLSLAAALLLALLSISGCSKDDTGYPCALPGTGSGTGSGLSRPIVVTNALDCFSRLCVRPASTEPSARGLCTRICDGDDDCPGADETCKSPGGQPQPYVCRVIQATGSLSCCKMCVCGAYVSGTSSDTDSACAGQTANCPSL